MRPLTRSRPTACRAFQAFHKGTAVFFEHLLDPDFLHAIKLTLMLAAVAVPVNVVFGLVAAINITRNEFPGKVRGRGAGAQGRAHTRPARAPALSMAGGGAWCVRCAGGWV